MNSPTPPNVAGLFPKVRLIKTPEEYNQVIDSARADADAINYPSHIIEHQGQIVGAASLGVVPLVLVWHHSKLIDARKSLHLKNIYDSIMETKGFPEYVIACNSHSNFNPHMKRLGFNPIWSTELFTGGVIKK